MAPFVTARPTSACSRDSMNAFELLPSEKRKRRFAADLNNSKAFMKSRVQAVAGLAATNGSNVTLFPLYKPYCVCLQPKRRHAVGVYLVVGVAGDMQYVCTWL